MLVGVLIIGVAALILVIYTQRERLLALWKQTRPATELTDTTVPVKSPDTPEATPKFSSPFPNPEIAAAQDLAEMTVWFRKQPWLVALRKSLPRGVSLTMIAAPYDAEGWSSVELRENHGPDSGFDRNVSPLVGRFRISRHGRKVEWLEPVSGEYQPLERFLKVRGLSGGTSVLRPEN